MLIRVLRGMKDYTTQTDGAQWDKLDIKWYRKGNRLKVKTRVRLRLAVAPSSSFLRIRTHLRGGTDVYVDL